MQHNLLDTIVFHKREELKKRKTELPLEHLQTQLSSSSSPSRDLRAAITKNNDLTIIAEIKRASPSAGIIKPNFNHVTIAQEYLHAGVEAISVLTDSHFFMGQLSFINEVKQVVGVPILRKDFIIDSYQVYESKRYGADAILLLAKILDDQKLQEYRELAQELDMQSLVECCNEREIQQALSSGAQIIGINNRNLETFDINLSTFAHLRALIPPELTVVSESGICTAQDALQMKQMGADAILVGTSIMAADDVQAKIRELHV